MAYATQAALAIDSTLLSKLKIALQIYALSVIGEAVGGVGEPTEEEHGLRLTLARAIIANPMGEAERLAWAIVADATLSSGSSDADISTQIGAVYNKLAGID